MVSERPWLRAPVVTIFHLLHLQVRNAMNTQMVKLDQELQEVKAANEELVKYKVRQKKVKAKEF